jgi:signal transduction histidine kinase
VNRKTLNIIILLICVALAGIIGVQYFWIRNAWKVKEAQFDRSVNDALTVTVGKLETREDLAYIRNNVVSDSIHMLVKAFSRDTVLALNQKLDSLLSADEMLRLPPPPSPPELQRQFYSFEYHFDDGSRHVDSVIQIPGDNSDFFRDHNINFSLEWRDDLEGRIDSIFSHGDFMYFDPAMQQAFAREENMRPTDGNPGKMPGAKPGRKPGRKPDQKPGAKQGKGKPMYVTSFPSRNRIPALGPGPDNVHREFYDLTRKAKKLKDVINKLAIEIESKPQPVEKRIDSANLVRTLKKSLAERDIAIPFEYAVVSGSGDTSKVPFRSAGFTNANMNTKHRVSLFPNDIFQKHEHLLVWFPNQKAQLFRSVSFLMLSSVFFTFIIVITSLASIFVMLRQKKISDIKTDFINNMTHEFKTPIATISIAADSINNPKVIEAPDKIRAYTKVIKEENSRMNSRVEQVLQMALLDSRDFMLNPDIIDLNLLVMKITDNLRLQIENRQGTLDVNCMAQRSMIEADEAHLSNVILNLLDNANKYSPVRPEIQVSTVNVGSNVLLSITDKGIGMSADTRNRIFDKFFRVTSGNLHNVKGFGLGLSYAKAIVLAHKGEISVTSEPGKGSTFAVKLPVAVTADELMS